MNRNLPALLLAALAACTGNATTPANPPPACTTPDAGLAQQPPALRAIQSAAFTNPYSCVPDGGTLGYEGTALFLSEYTRGRNAPELLYNGACHSGPNTFQVATAGNDFGLLADLGTLPLEQVSAHRAFNPTNVVGGDAQFSQSVAVVAGHTYSALVSRPDLRALFAFHVEQATPDGPAAIRYVVLTYEIHGNIAESPGFDWEATSH